MRSYPTDAGATTEEKRPKSKERRGRKKMERTFGFSLQHFLEYRRRRRRRRRLSRDRPPPSAAARPFTPGQRGKARTTSRAHPLDKGGRRRRRRASAASGSARSAPAVPPAATGSLLVAPAGRTGEHEKTPLAAGVENDKMGCGAGRKI